MSRVAVLLAAGSSRRFGAGNKMLARIGGDTMLARGLAIARAAPAARLIVTAGWQWRRVAAAARGPRTTIVRVPGYREGLAASLRAVRAALRPRERELLLFLADMPWADADAARWLVRAASPGDAIVRPAWRGRPGHPVLLRGQAIDALAKARGDEGPGRRGARLIPADRRAIADIDRPAGLRRRPPALR